MASPSGNAPPEQPGRNPRELPPEQQSAQHVTPIEDYALIGDCRSAALVSRDGSIDWLCWPRFDSPACFAAIVGTADNGRWRIAPHDPPVQVSRQYRRGTMILETVFDTKDGSVALIDFMTATSGNSSVVRIVEGRSGQVAMRLDLALRFDYGSAVPWVTQLHHRTGLRAIAGPDLVLLASGVQLHGQHLTTVGEFTVAAGSVCRSCCHMDRRTRPIRRFRTPTRRWLSPRRSGPRGLTSAPTMANGASRCSDRCSR